MVALLLKAANCEQLFNNKSLVFNNFIHNSEQGEVLLTEPVVLHPQLLQGLKRKACIIFCPRLEAGSSAGTMRTLKLRLAQTFIEMKIQLWPISFTIMSERDIVLNEMYVNLVLVFNVFS